jgi:hypothetical protein
MARYFCLFFKYVQQLTNAKWARGKFLTRGCPKVKFAPRGELGLNVTLMHRVFLE